MKIVEGIMGYYFYHLSKSGHNGRPAICGEKRVMSTEIPLNAWGKVTHIGERYCKICDKKYREIKEAQCKP